jgi:hypothetical protein
MLDSTDDGVRGEAQVICISVELGLYIRGHQVTEGVEF